MERAEIYQPRKGFERHAFRQVLLDMVRDDTLLPRGEPSPYRVIGATEAGCKTDEFVREHHTERFRNT